MRRDGYTRGEFHRCDTAKETACQCHRRIEPFPSNYHVVSSVPEVLFKLLSSTAALKRHECGFTSHKREKAAHNLSADFSHGLMRCNGSFVVAPLMSANRRGRFSRSIWLLTKDSSH